MGYKHQQNDNNMTKVKIQQKKVIIWYEGTNVYVSRTSDFYMYVIIKFNAVFNVEYPQQILRQAVVSTSVTKSLGNISSIT
jgi:hypothetical protein